MGYIVHGVAESDRTEGLTLLQPSFHVLTVQRL